MITNNQKQKLINNWGEKASSMACMAEVRVYDPLSHWECYIYALNPEDENQICCLIRGFFVEVTDWTLSELSSLFNSEGESLKVDNEYRPRMAAQVFKKLNETRIYDADRD